jgi:hypothetical protein
MPAILGRRKQGEQSGTRNGVNFKEHPGAETERIRTYFRLWTEGDCLPLVSEGLCSLVAVGAAGGVGWRLAEHIMEAFLAWAMGSLPRPSGWIAIAYDPSRGFSFENAAPNSLFFCD